MSFNKYNSEKQKWIKEYENLIQNYKNEELDLLKLFLLKNYHLNKVYKKYVYKEKEKKFYYSEIQKKIRNSLNENNENKTKENLNEIINNIKEEYNKEYLSLIKEENKIEKELKLFLSNNNEMININEFDEWLKSNKNITLSNLVNLDLDKENISISNISQNERKQNFYSTNYNTDNDCIKNSEISSVSQDNNSNNLKNIFECLNGKNEYTPKIIERSLNFYEDPIENYFKKLKKEINNIYMHKYSSKTISNFNPANDSIINMKDDEKFIINNIKLYLNKKPEDKNTFNYFNEKIKKANYIIKEELGGIYLGWTESEHKEFIKLKNMFKDKINSFLFLSNLNNLFPYMTVSKLKKHIKLYDIYLKFENIRNLLIEKFNCIKNLIKNDKNKSSKEINTSISVTKSFSSSKINNFIIKRKNMNFLENKRNTTINNRKLNKIKISKDYLKSSFKSRTKDNFYNNKKKEKRNNYNFCDFNI